MPETSCDEKIENDNNYKETSTEQIYFYFCEQLLAQQNHN